MTMIMVRQLLLVVFAATTIVMLQNVVVVSAFVVPFPLQRTTTPCTRPQEAVVVAERRFQLLKRNLYREDLFDDDDDDDEEDDDEDDDSIDPSSLGDWRTFRRNLAASFESSSSSAAIENEKKETSKNNKNKNMETDDIDADLRQLQKDLQSFRDSTSTTSTTSSYSSSSSSSSSTSTTSSAQQQQQTPSPYSSSAHSNTNNDDNQQQQQQNQRQRLTKSVSKENEDLLKSQCERLAQEYVQGVWAHTTPTPEVGGLVVRLPLEAELFRNHRHSLNGQLFRKQAQAQAAAAQQQQASKTNNSKGKKQTPKLTDTSPPSVYFPAAQKYIEQSLLKLSEAATAAQTDDDEYDENTGQIDASTLDEQSSELLSLFLDHQETWQEVCLVAQHDPDTGSAVTYVLNRLMALKLTDQLAQLLLYGAYSTTTTTTTTGRRRRRTINSSSSGNNQNQRNKNSSRRIVRTRPRHDDTDFRSFVQAFGQECCPVYIGGPDDQHQPAEIIHGFASIPGSVEIAPYTGIFLGGSMHHIVQGVLNGLYKPMDFRFFLGKHVYENYDDDDNNHNNDGDNHNSNDGTGGGSGSSGTIKNYLANRGSGSTSASSTSLDVSVLLGKYQPIACARSLALKQCISLPKPLWHEVMELCDDGSSNNAMKALSTLELLKRDQDDLRFQIVEDDDDDDESAFYDGEDVGDDKDDDDDDNAYFDDDSVVMDSDDDDDEGEEIYG